MAGEGQRRQGGILKCLVLFFKGRVEENKRWPVAGYFCSVNIAEICTSAFSMKSYLSNSFSSCIVF